MGSWSSFLPRTSPFLYTMMPAYYRSALRAMLRCKGIRAARSQSDTPSPPCHLRDRTILVGPTMIGRGKVAIDQKHICQSWRLSDADHEISVIVLKLGKRHIRSRTKATTWRLWKKDQRKGSKETMRGKRKNKGLSTLSYVNINSTTSMLPIKVTGRARP